MIRTNCSNINHQNYFTQHMGVAKIFMKKPYSIRFDPELMDQFDKKVFPERRSKAIEKIIKQFLKDQQHHEKLEEKNDELNSIIENKSKENDTLRQKLSELSLKCQQIQKDLQNSENKCNDIQQQLNKKEKRIEQIQQQHQEELDKLQTKHSDEIKELKKEKTKYQNKYDHQVALKDKLQKDHNKTLTENGEYKYFFGKVISMSLWDRLRGNYPEEIKELQPPQPHEKKQQKE